MTIRAIRIEGELAFVPLTKGYEAMVDAADVSLVDGANWHARVKRHKDGSIRTVYAERNFPIGKGKYRIVQMHRVIAATPEDMQTDHISGDGLDNRRSNLRHATNAQNGRNRSANFNSKCGVKGVNWNKSHGRFHARITQDQKLHHLGYFDSIEEAAAAYAKASAELHGEFGRVDVVTSMGAA